MNNVNDEAENLRELAIRFATEVLHLPPPNDFPVNYTGNNADLIQFLNHLSTRLDGAGNHRTRPRFTELVGSYLRRRIPRSRLHAEVCILFIGHADLFNRFERLRFINDGLQETCDQIREWREEVRHSIMPEVSTVLAYCRSAIEILTRRPDSLDRRNLAFIARTCFKEGFLTGLAVNNSSNRYRVLLQLVTNPSSVKGLVLPALRAKQTRFRQFDRLLTLYFRQVVSMDLSMPYTLRMAA